MNPHKAFILGVALLSTIWVKAQYAIDNYKAVFTSCPQHVPTTKTPDAPLAGNGDIGIIESVDLQDRTLLVNFDGRSIEYDATELDELVHAYATTIHKAQGSEYPIVVMPVLMNHFVMLQRNLIYTGITRAKRILVMVGTKKALAYAVRNVTVTRRNTLLKERLAGQIQVKNRYIRCARLNDFRTFRFLREIVHCSVYLFIYLDKGQVRISTEIKRQADNTGAVSRLTVNIFQCRNLYQLAAQRFHNRIFQFAGRCIGSRHLYSDLRNSDIRKQRYRKCRISHQPDYKTGGESHQHGNRTLD